jgi:tetratricopeptide (TPR) repeat protein
MVGLTLVVVGSVLAIGSVHFEAILAVAGACTLTLAAAWIWRARLKLSPPALVLLGLAGYSLLQCIPLPMAWLARIAPKNAEIWAGALSPLAEAGPGHAPISLDPGATAIEAVRWTCYAAVFVIAGAIARRRGARFGLTLMVASASVAGVSTLVHGLLDAKRVFGVYEPTFPAQSWHVGPLLNPNNLSGYLNLGIACGLGLFVAARDPNRRHALALVVIALVGVNLTTASRAGVTAMLLAAILFAMVLARRPKSELGLGRAPLLATMGIVVGGALLGLLGFSYAAGRELVDDSLAKLELFAWSERMCRDFAWLGSGRGAFASVFPAYQRHSGSVVFAHPENFVVSWIAEWGLPAALVALVTLAIVLQPSKLARRSRVEHAAAYIGAAALGLQNLIDVGFEVPGMCIALSLLLGTLWGARRCRRTSESPVTSPRRPVALALAVAVAVTCLHAVARDRRDLDGERRDLAERTSRLEAGDARRNPSDRDALRGAIRAAILRHPAEPHFPLLGAVLAIEHGDQNAMPWLARTLERGSASGKAHLLLAKLLAARGLDAQARLEARLAIMVDHKMIVPAAVVAARVVRSLGDAMELASDGKDAPSVLDALGAQLTMAGKRELARAIDLEALLRDRMMVWPRLRLAADSVGEIERCSATEAEGHRSCLRGHAAAVEIAVHIAVLTVAAPGESHATQLRARWFAALGKKDRAEELLASSCSGYRDRRDCLELRVRIAATIADVRRLRSAGGELEAACSDGHRCAELAGWIATLYAQRAEWEAATESWQHAVRVEPSFDRWLALAEAASHAGFESVLQQALRRAEAMAGDRTEQRLRIDEVRSHADQRRRDAISTKRSPTLL